MSDIISELEKFRVIYGLKQVYRLNSVGNRKESTAEHVSSTIMLADFLMTKYDFNVDKLRVIELILYHDLVEIHAGDTPFHPKMERGNQKEREEIAAKRLIKELPYVLSKKYALLHKEFEERKTREAKFAKAMDALDADIHELDYKKDWDGWTAKFLIEKKGPYFNDFPELQRLFDEHIKYCIENGFLKD